MNIFEGIDPATSRLGHADVTQLTSKSQEFAKLVNSPMLLLVQKCPHFGGGYGLVGTVFSCQGGKVGRLALGENCEGGGRNILGVCRSSIP